MTTAEKMYRYQSCQMFFDKLAEELNETHEILGPTHRGMSRCLCVKGTTNQVTYEGKPELSLRVAQRWNWYANVKKCPEEKYVQCFNRDLPRPKKRKAPGEPSDPIIASCVSLFLGNKYRVVYGEKFNPKTKEWTWLETDPAELANYILWEMAK